VNFKRGCPSTHSVFVFEIIELLASAVGIKLADIWRMLGKKQLADESTAARKNISGMVIASFLSYCFSVSQNFRRRRKCV
jgi:hypothetical protein